MKYIRLYEELSNKPEVGDYVICDESDGPTELHIFLSNNIGQLIKIDKDEDEIEDADLYLRFRVKYEYRDISKKCLNYFSRSNRIFFLSEIDFWSSNKEDCEAFLDASKYNI